MSVTNKSHALWSHKDTERDRNIKNITSAREGLKKTDRNEGKRERKRCKELMNASLFSSQINKASSCLSENARERETESTQCLKKKNNGHSKKKKKHWGGCNWINKEMERKTEKVTRWEEERRSRWGWCSARSVRWWDKHKLLMSVHQMNIRK